MIGASAIDAMRKMLENNSKILGKRKRLKDVYKEYGSNKKIVYKKPIHHDSSPEQLKTIRTKLRRKNKIYYTVQVLLLLTLTILVFGSIYYFFGER